MTQRTFAPWVEPVAAELRQSRAEIARTARQLLPEHWSMPSPLEGWTYKDLLAHLATGDWLCQARLESVVNRTEPPWPDGDVLDWISRGNARRIEERRARTPDELIAEVEAEGEETQALLARLSNDNEASDVKAPAPLGDYLRGFPGHDRSHLAQLKTALDSVMM